MFKRTKEKPRVFLGTILVNDKPNVKRLWGDKGWTPDEDMQHAFHKQLSDIFALAPMTVKANHGLNDLGLDIGLQGIDQGMSLRFRWFPIIWRPRIHLQARLFNIQTQQEMASFEITENAQWKEVATRYDWIFDDLFFGKKELIVLINRASTKLLQKVVKAAHKYA